MSITLAIAIDGYLLFFKKSSAENIAIDSSVNSQSNSNASESSSASSSSSSSSVDSGYQNGTYTGKSASMRWGNVQVKVTISNGEITKVQTIKYPTDNPHDQQVNSSVLPTYEDEAVKNDSSKIQSFSGATETWKGFTKSLQSALNKAES
ncbi:FMN-binding protein [Oenococcus oeni]|nr:FMN-binding protein [Oenococcus oeni]UCU86320.1 FMN-binding protein [Oenococcus oeni]